MVKRIKFVPLCEFACLPCVFEACISKTIELTNERHAHPNIDQPVDQSQAWNFPKLPSLIARAVASHEVSVVNRLVCCGSLDA